MPNDNAHHPATLLITGSSRGIGLEITRQALLRGDRVVATCRHPAAAVELTALRSKHGDTIEILALDVTSDTSVAALVDTLGDRPIDVLVNNAGVYGGSQTLADMDYAAWAEAFAVNAMAPLRVATALLPALRRSSHPRIVTLSSIMGSLERDSTANYAYCSSKSAVNKVMKTLADELRADGIIVVPVHPGWVRTDMGGPEADLSPEQSARGLLTLFDGLTPERSGRFFAWDGEELPW